MYWANKNDLDCLLNGPPDLNDEVNTSLYNKVYCIKINI